MEVLALSRQRHHSSHYFLIVVKPGKRVAEDKANTFCPCVWSEKETGESEAKNGAMRDRS